MSGATQDTSFVSAHTRAVIAVASLLACAAISFIQLILHLLRLLRVWPFSYAAEDVASLEGGTNWGALITGLVWLAQVVVFVATVVVFLIWLHRAYKNLRAFGVRTEMSPGWAVGNWFIPFLNLARPYQSVKELWIKSDPAVDFTHGFAKPGAGAHATSLVGFWWLAWLVANFVGRAYGRIAGAGIASSRPEVVEWAGEASSILTLAAALLAASVVWAIDRMQTEKSRRFGFNVWSTPPPPPASFDEPQGGAQV